MKKMAFHFICGQSLKGDRAVAEAEKVLRKVYPSANDDEINFAIEKAVDLEKASRDYGRQCRLGKMTETQAQEELEKNFPDYSPNLFNFAMAHGFFIDRWLEFCEENKIDPETKYFCPMCKKKTEHSTCPDCGLWWLTPGSLKKPAKNQTPSDSEVFDLTLREYMHPANFIILPFLIVLGLGANLLILLNLFSNPSSLALWISLLVCLPLGGVIGTICLMFFIKALLKMILPSKLHGDREFLHVKMWNTWDEHFFKGFSRFEAKVPKASIEGIEISKTQGGESDLFLLHTSGKAFGIGWQGSARRAEMFADEILAWLAASGEKPER